MEAGALPGVPTTLNSGECRNGGEGLLSWPISTDSQRRPFYLTMNIGEKPRVPNPTRLSEILEPNPDPKYNLSETACQGILRRAERRGKVLPPELKAALIVQSASKETGATEPIPPNATGADGVGGGIEFMHIHDDEVCCCLRASMRQTNAPIVAIYDARGTGGGVSRQPSPATTKIG